MSLNTNIAALILAAGRSSRMGEGRHKLLLPLAGRPVLAHVVEAARAAQTRPVVVVLGYQAEQVQASLHTHCNDPDLVLVKNPVYAEGMSTSLHAGIHTLMRQPQEGCQGVVVLLGDQPLVTAALIDRLISARQETGKAIIVPLYAGKRGNPVLFDARLFPELLNVTGDEGGRSVIERHRAEIASVEMGSVQAWYDVDTWDAYQQVLDAWQAHL